MDLIEKGNPGYSKQQMQIRNSTGTVTPAPLPNTNPNNQVATTIGGKQYNAGGGLINPSSAITSTSLAPVKAVTLPNQVTPTAGAGLSGAVTASTDTIAKQNQDALLAEQQIAKDTSNASLSKTLADMMQTNADISNAASTIDRTAEDAAKKLANDYTSQIESEALALRRQTDALKANNPQGLFGGALQDEVNRIERDSLSKQADLAILQNAATRNYETANAIADRQLALKLEPYNLKAKNLELFYNANKDIFTKADDRLYADAVKKADAELKKATDIETEISNLKKNVAQYAGTKAQSILNEMSKIDTTKPGAVDKALSIAGNYQSDPLDRKLKNLQIDKLTADIAKTNTNITPQVINNVNNSQYKPALDVILGSAKFTKDQKASVIQAVNNGKDPFIVIKNQAKSILGTEGKEVIQLEKAKAQVQNIDTLLNQYYSKGGDTSLLKGSYEKTLNKLGTVKDPDLVDISVNIASALQAYRNAVSGTAYSVKEGQEIASVFPGINKSEGLNKAIIKGRLQAFDTDIDSGYESALGSTYTDLKKAYTDPLGALEVKKAVVTPQNPLGLNI